MAEVKRTTVEKLVTKTEQVPAYTLTLSKDEALAVMVLVGNVGGSSHDTPRKHADAVYHGLRRAGLDVVSHDFQRQLKGTVRFEKNPTKSPYSY
jgi:hypothetical protein